jgi:phosphoribosyl 1,2-cyclic phosphodiesterase
MRVAFLASGSRGNALAVTAGGTTVLVDAGLGPRTLTARARAAGVDLSTVAAVFLSHEHGDHARGVSDVARLAGCAVYASSGTLAALRGRVPHAQCRALEPDRSVTVGAVTVDACCSKHDAAEPLAFAVTERGTGARLGVTGDVGTVTPPLRRLLAGARCVVIEANHDPDLLERGPYPAGLRRRIAGPGGHLSNDAAGVLAAELCHPGLETVVLAHLSERCNRPELARAAVLRHLAPRGFGGRLFTATQRAVPPPFEVGFSQYSLEGIV